jgi:imidazolonepropionase-like amidohydrolase
MIDYGMTALETLKSATSVNADAFHVADKVGRLKKGLLADIIAVEGNPMVDIRLIRKVLMVMKDGKQ